MTIELDKSSPLWKWAIKKYKYGFIPYVILAFMPFFNLNIALVATILWVGIRTELLFACLRYGNEINHRRIAVIEEKAGIEVDNKLIHSYEG